MSETPTPSKPAAISTKLAGPVKRGGLALPPRGQALARLQDLEEEGEPVALTTDINAKDPSSTASSNAVNKDDEDDQAALLPSEAAAVPLKNLTTRQPKASAASGTSSAPKATPAPKAVVDYQVPPRAAREPTTRITVDMPDSLHQKISVLSAQTRRSIKDLVIEALAVTYFGTDTDPQ